MKTVLFIDIDSFLKDSGIAYSLTSMPAKEYQVASIFNPVPNGFYFFAGSQIPEIIQNSLLLVENSNENLVFENGNVGIFINTNPQLVFYRFLGLRFPEVSNGKISETAIIHPNAKIGKNVQIDHFCVIGDAEIRDSSIIKSHCFVNDNCTIGFNVILEPMCLIGAQGVAWIWNDDQSEKIIQPQLGGVQIEDNCFLGANTIVVRGSINENTIIGKSSLFAPGCRIGHGTKIGEFVHFANNVVTGGNTQIGAFSFVGSSAVFRPKVVVHEKTIVGTGSVVVKNTSKPGMTLMGVPAKESETKQSPNGMPKPKK